MNKVQLEILKRKIKYSPALCKFYGEFTPVEILFLVNELDVIFDSHWTVTRAEIKKAAGISEPTHQGFHGSKKLKEFRQI